MAFHGLFVGVDRYASRSIGWLSCCANDARALGALFQDNLGGHVSVLVDGQATRAGLMEHLQALQKCDPDDFVVIGFSGHGSETHELAPYDADPQNLAATALPLEELAELFRAIPAKNLWCILDCCFAGGLGAKVLHVDLKAKAIDSVDEALREMSGEGRLILAASSATEEAWESGGHRHSLLTYFVLEALQGPTDVLRAGKLQPYLLLDYVTKRVVDTSGQFGKAQHPAVRGTFDGEPSWPVFVPGSTYLGLFPERGRLPATEQISSLANFGFPQDLLSAWAGAIPSLNALQVSAINEFGILEGQHLVVSAPTSSGKTMIGELAALQGALNRRRAVFLLPLKALVADKHLYFDRVYKPLGIRTIEATGDSDDVSELLRGQYDIALLTYEKFAAVVLAYPHVLEQTGTVVIDEVQMIADESRGATLEFLLTLLRMRQSSRFAPQVIALSAVIGDTNGLERWLGARLLRRNERPVPLDEGLMLRDGSWQYLDGVSGETKTLGSRITPEWSDGKSRGWIIPLVRTLLTEGKQVIVFRATKSETFFCAQYLADSLGLPPASAVIESLPAGDEARVSLSLRKTLNGGVAFHHADLSREERRAIEEAFRAPDSELRVIVATTTLAMGVNTPAQAVVIQGLEHPAGGGETKPYSVAEYKNLVGRAGRLGISERGESYLLAVEGMSSHSFWEHYVTGVPENLESRFLHHDTDIRSLVLRVCTFASRFYDGGMGAKEVADFLESSFGAFQEQQRTDAWTWNRATLEEEIRTLIEHRLLKSDDQNHLVLTPLGRIAGEGGLAIESVVRLVECFSTVQPSDLSDPALIASCQFTTELDDTLFPLNRRSTQKEPAYWPSVLRDQGISSAIASAFHRRTSDPHAPTLRAKRAASCLYFIAGVPMADIEKAMVQFGGGFTASGAVRTVADRTGDVLGTAARIAEIIHPGLDLSDRMDRLLVRLSAGVQGGVVDIARHARGAFTRAEYAALNSAGYGTTSSVAEATDEALLQVLGGNRTKVDWLRDAARAEEDRRRSLPLPSIPLPPYEA